MGLVSRLLRIAMFAALLFVVSGEAMAAARGGAVFSGAGPAEGAVALSTCVARADANGRPAAAFDCGNRQNALGSGSFVTELVFAPVQPSRGDPLVLRTSSLWQEAETVEFRYADGIVRRLLFTKHDAARYLTIGSMLEFPVPDLGVPLVGIRIHTVGSANLRGVVQGAELLPTSEAFRIRQVITAIYAAFAGLAVALMIYNFALWRALRNRFQLYYCAMVGALAAYTFSSSGAIMFVFDWMGNNDRLRLNHLLLALCAVTGVGFVRRFFGAHICPPWLDRLTRQTSTAALGSAIAYALFAPSAMQVLDRLYFISMAVLLASAVPIMVIAWQKRAEHFGLFMVAWSAPLVIFALRVAYGFNLVPYSLLLDNGNLISMSIEALLSSLMVTARLRDLTRERDFALIGERAARELAATDPLTGLLNRRAFLDRAIGRRARQRLILIDIDHFKAVNDRLGHDAGDRVLAEVARAIERVMPQGSLAVRLGGEEFALLVPRAAIDTVPPTRILSEIRATAMPDGLKVTISIGFSEGQIANENDWKRLYRLADAALYRAKADGRDRACRATDFRTAA